MRASGCLPYRHQAKDRARRAVPLCTLATTERGGGPRVKRARVLSADAGSANLLWVWTTAAYVLVQHASTFRTQQPGGRSKSPSLALGHLAAGDRGAHVCVCVCVCPPPLGVRRRRSGRARSGGRRRPLRRARPWRCHAHTQSSLSRCAHLAGCCLLYGRHHARHS